MGKIPIPSHLVLEIVEEEGSNIITLKLKNNFNIKVSKNQFDNYEEYKQSVEYSLRNRP